MIASMEETLERLSPPESAAAMACQAAELIAVVWAPDRETYQETLCNAKKVLTRYNAEELITGANFDDIKDVTRKLYKVFTLLDTNEAADAVNMLLAEFAAMPCLGLRDGEWRLRIDGVRHASRAEQFAASSALAFATLLAGTGRNPCRLCTSPTCRRPYIDLGRGIGRKYCSPRCATRERVAAYRQKTAH
jgi:predicted RNA-binding Zn ribbon-like protein